ASHRAGDRVLRRAHRLSRRLPRAQAGADRARRAHGSAGRQGVPGAGGAAVRADGPAALVGDGGAAPARVPRDGAALVVRGEEAHAAHALLREGEAVVAVPRRHVPHDRGARSAGMGADLAPRRGGGGSARRRARPGRARPPVARTVAVLGHLRGERRAVPRVRRGDVRDRGHRGHGRDHLGERARLRRDRRARAPRGSALVRLRAHLGGDRAAAPRLPRPRPRRAAGAGVPVDLRGARARRPRQPARAPRRGRAGARLGRAGARVLGAPCRRRGRRPDRLCFRGVGRERRGDGGRFLAQPKISAWGCRFRAAPFDRRQGGSPMKYMLIIYDNEKVWNDMPEAQKGQLFGEYMSFTDGIKKSGHSVSGAPLQPVSTATSVRVREGKTLKTDGPFAETREQLGGYYLVEAKDLDEACKIAARIPSSRIGTIEVRPVMEIPGA